MALKLDNNLIDELGLGALPEQEKQLLLRQIYEKLEMNVGVRLADQMSNEQLDEFEKFVDANDDKGAFQWLETNFPNYKDVVNEEFEKLKAEIKQYAPQMLAVAQHNSQQAAAGAQQMPGPGPHQVPAGMQAAPNGQYPPQYSQSAQPGQPTPSYQPAQSGQYQPQPQFGGQPMPNGAGYGQSQQNPLPTGAGGQSGQAGPVGQPVQGSQPTQPYYGPQPSYGQPQSQSQSQSPLSNNQPDAGQSFGPQPSGQGTQSNASGVPGVQPSQYQPPFPGQGQPQYPPYPDQQPPAGPPQQ